MSIAFKFLLFFSLLVTLNNAEEKFITSNFPLAQISLSTGYCKTITEDKQFCKRKALNYIDFKDSNLPTEFRGIQTYIAPILQKYTNNHVKASTLRDIKEFGDEISGEWYNEATINLFSTTPNTYTLANNYNGYTGGAHGYHGISYHNIDKRTQESIKLSTLFLPDANQTFHIRAAQYYKEEQGLKPNQSLVDDGWFENKFVLAENFALTPRGIYFYYNSYEIKSYADGPTKFMLPYSAIRDIIDPKGALAFVLTQRYTPLHTVYQSEEMQLTLDAQRHRDYTITVTATLKSLTYAKQGWLSVSLPQVNSKDIILSTDYKGFKQLISYDNHNKIYNTTLKKARYAKYLLIEADKKDISYDTSHTMQFKLKVPKELKNLIIDIRATLKQKNKMYTLPDAYEGIKGQQGYKNYRVILDL